MARGTTRKGRPIISLQTLVDRFSKKKQAADVRMTEALDAAKVLDQDPRTRVQRYRNAALTGGTLNPVVRGVGRAAERMVMAPKGQRLQAGVKAIASTNRGELARHATEGALAGGGIKAVQEGLEVGQAKKKITNYLATPPKVASKNPKGQLTHFVKGHWRSKKAAKEKKHGTGTLASALGAQAGALSHRHSTMATSAALGAALSGDPETKGRRAVGAGIGSILGREGASRLAHAKIKSPEFRVAARAAGLMGGAAAGNAAGQATKTSAEKKPAQSRLALKPVSSPDLDFEV